MLEQDQHAGELEEAEKILRFMFPTDAESATPLDPRKEAFHEPAALAAPQAPTILHTALFAIRPMRHNHLGALLLQILVDLIAVIGSIANQALLLRFEHIKVNTLLDRGDFMVIRGMGADREGEAVTVPNCQNFHAFAALGQADLAAAPLRLAEGGIDKAFRLIHRALLAQGIGQLDEDATQSFITTCW